ncbi:hypothetical protein ACF05W_23735 [Streptomyces lydicus]|uniref:hypothetical protein n=1 Tax=Streptomyces lydicus TaxID=47763 RepID=UPI0036FD07C7
MTRRRLSGSWPVRAQVAGTSDAPDVGAAVSPAQFGDILLELPVVHRPDRVQRPAGLPPCLFGEPDLFRLGLASPGAYQTVTTTAARTTANATSSTVPMRGAPSGLRRWVALLLPVTPRHPPRFGVQLLGQPTRAPLGDSEFLELVAHLLKLLAQLLCLQLQFGPAAVISP